MQKGEQGPQVESSLEKLSKVIRSKYFMREKSKFDPLNRMNIKKKVADHNIADKKDKQFFKKFQKQSKVTLTKINDILPAAPEKRKTIEIDDEEDLDFEIPATEIKPKKPKKLKLQKKQNLNKVIPFPNFGDMEFQRPPIEKIPPKILPTVQKLNPFSHLGPTKVVPFASVPVNRKPLLPNGFIFDPHRGEKVHYRTILDEIEKLFIPRPSSSSEKERYDELRQLYFFKKLVHLWSKDEQRSLDLSEIEKEIDQGKHKEIAKKVDALHSVLCRWGHLPVILEEAKALSFDLELEIECSEFGEFDHKFIIC